VINQNVEFSALLPCILNTCNTSYLWPIRTSNGNLAILADLSWFVFQTNANSGL
jgi:hypothetical protein